MNNTELTNTKILKSIYERWVMANGSACIHQFAMDMGLPINNNIADAFKELEDT